MAPPKPKQTIAAICEQWRSRLRPRIDGKAVTGSGADVKALAVQLAGVKIDDEAAKGSPASSVSISIGNVVLNAENALEQIGTSIEFAKDVLDSENLIYLDDLDGARGTLNELSEKKDALSDFKRKNPEFEHYKIVSFSKLTKSQISDMGVTSVTLDHDQLKEILHSFDTFRLPIEFTEKREMPILTIFNSFWLNLVKDGRFINDFKIVKKNIGKKPEARARMLTDYILTQLLVFVDMHLAIIQFMFLELPLSSSSDPVPVFYKSTATLLTGSVDYTILSSAPVTKKLAAMLGVEPDKVEESIREKISGSSLDDVINSEYWHQLEQRRHFKFTIIEEKRKDLGNKNLIDCEPQVTGEALALKSKANLDYVQWCLSNGDDWIFGTLNSDLQSRSLPLMSVCDDDLEGSIKDILRMLILWTLGTDKLV